MGLKLDKYFGLRTPISDTQLGTAEKEWERALEKGIPGLDTICASEQEINSLLDLLEGMERPSAELVEQPPLAEFDLEIAEPIPSRLSTTVCFRKTKLPQTAARIDGEDGYHQELVPYADAYVYFNQKEKADLIITIYAVRFYKDGVPLRLTATGQRLMALREDSDVSLNCKEDETLLNETLRDIRLCYLAIQNVILERPTVFYESGLKPALSHRRSGGHKKKNRTRIVKRICVNADELSVLTRTHRTILCPCWGVMGHYRTLRSGRKVWIKPYRKGKQRNNPDAYVSKEYLLEVSE